MSKKKDPGQQAATYLRTATVTDALADLRRGDGPDTALTRMKASLACQAQIEEIVVDASLFVQPAKHVEPSEAAPYPDPYADDYVSPTFAYMVIGAAAIILAVVTLIVWLWMA